MWTTYDAPGGPLSYRRTGSGPLLVCVPGGPGMDPDAYFAGLDLPGHELVIHAPRATGRSAPAASDEGYRIDGYVADLESLRVHLGEERLALYGNSHGGMVVLAYACRHPDRVHRFVVTNGPASMGAEFRAACAATAERFTAAAPDAAERIAAATKAAEVIEDAGAGEEERRSAFRTLMARYAFREGPAVSAYLDRLCAAPMAWHPSEVMYDELNGGLDLLDEASRAAAPALVLAGEFDVTVPPEVMRGIADALPNATFHEFPGVGHFPEVEAPEDFTRIVTEFLAGHQS